MICLTSYATAQSPQIDAFIASADALISAADDAFKNKNSVTRLAKLRLELTNTLIGAHTKGERSFAIAISNSKILCEPRGEGLDAAIAKGYIQSLSTEIARVAEPRRFDNLFSAIGAVFSSHNLDVQGPIETDEQLIAAKNRVVKRCERDLAGYSTAYYGVKPEAVMEAAVEVGVFAAVGTVIDVFKKLVQPFILEGAAMIDEAKREAAIRAFLTNPENVAAIRSAGEVLSTRISRDVWDERLRLTGEFAAQAASYRSKSIDLSEVEGCDAYFEGASGSFLGPEGETTDSFAICWEEAWKRVATSAKPLLSAAARYDQLADAGDSDNAKAAFRRLSSNLEAIGRGDIEPEQVWTWATRLIAYGRKVESATNKKNRDQIERAIDDLVDALTG